MRVSPQLRIGDAPGDFVDKRRHRFLVERGDLKFLGREADDFPVLQVHYVLGARDDRGHIARHDVFAVAQAEDQRRALTGGNHFAREIDAHGHDPVGALGVEQCFADAGEEAVLTHDLGLLGVVIGDQIAENLGVGFGGEGVPL